MSSSPINTGTHTTVKMEQWSKGSKGNSTIWGALHNAGYSDKEIVEKKLVEQVAKDNNLKDPNLVKVGQEINIPKKIKETRKEYENKGLPNPVKSENFVKLQSETSKNITGEHSSNENKTKEHGENKEVDKKIEHYTTRSGWKGEHETETIREKEQEAKFTGGGHVNSHGIEGHLHGKVAAGAKYEHTNTRTAKKGNTEISAHTKGEVQMETGAHIGGETKLNKDGLVIKHEAGAEIKGEVGAEIGSKIKHGSTELSNKADIKAGAEAWAKTNNELSITRNGIKVDNYSGAKAEIGTSVGASQELKMKGGKIKVENRAGAVAEATAERGHKLEISRDAFEIGGKAKAEAGAYVYTEHKVGARTEAGSGADIGVQLRHGAEVGAGVEGDLRIDKKGIHLEGGVSGSIIEGVALKGSVDFKYEDMKKPEFMLGTAIGGPIGGVAAVMAKPVIEKAGKAVYNGAKEVGQTIAHGAEVAYDATTNAIGGAVSSTVNGVKGLWDSIWK